MTDFSYSKGPSGQVEVLFIDGVRWLSPQEAAEQARVTADKARADEREGRAPAIEEFADDWSDWDAIIKAGDDMLAIRDMVRDAIHDAARIARGEQP